MRYIYNFLVTLILPFLPLRLVWRARKNQAYCHHILERFGYFSCPALKECLWVHAASVGEALAAVPLIKALRQHYPQLPLIVTTVTPTGRAQIYNIFHSQLLQLYLPYDHPFIVQRFFHHFNPKVLILMETELWPNILYYSAKKRTPVILCNARLSQKSFNGYKKIPSFRALLLRSLTTIIAQSKLDAERFLALGFASHQITITGNIKFDISIPDAVRLHALKLRTLLGTTRPIWVAASTHHLEEEKVLLAAKQVLAALPQALLILVPRHPERFTTVVELCQQQGFNAIRYSMLPAYTATTNIIVGDVMGQLLLFYAVSDIAFVGGSLIPWGGHNLLEPAALTKPLVTGPHLNAFLEISDTLLAAQALVKVQDELQLSQYLLKLFADPLLREQQGHAAWTVVETYRGVTTKILAIVTPIISQAVKP